jgi:glycosyltransferase involved in cell wall biosynthesis
MNANAELNRIRILHIITDLCPAGAEIKLYKMLQASDSQRFQFAVISLRDRGELGDHIQSLGIPVYPLDIRGSLPGPVALVRLVRAVRQFKPDLIHGWMYHGNLAAQTAAVFGNRPRMIWSIHQSLQNFHYEKYLTSLIIRLCARMSRLPDSIVYNSKTSATQHEAVGYRKEKSIVLFNGFDTTKFAPSAEARRTVDAELNLPTDAILIGLAGRYHPVKDHSGFIQAAALISKKYPGAKFLLCGRGIDHENLHLRQMIDELRLAHNVYLLGERRDIECIMPALDIAVSSSFSEGFPNVIGEAMSSATPCVVTDVSDVAEIVGSTGRVVPAGNPTMLAAAIEDLIVMGSEKRRLLGAAARNRIVESYSLEWSVSQYERIYRALSGT